MKEGAQLLATPTIADIFPCLAAADLQGTPRRFGELIRYGNGIVDEEIMHRRRGRDAGEPRKDDMVDLMIDKEKEWEEEGSEVNYDVVRDFIGQLWCIYTKDLASNG